MTRQAPPVPADDAAFEAARGLARQGFWRLDPASNGLLLSEEAYRIYGYDPALGQPTLEMVLACYPPGAQIRLRQGLRLAAETGRELSLTAILTRRDGARRDVLLRFRAGPCETSGRTAIWGCILDLTDAQTLDERLQREKDLLQTTLDHMDQGLIVVDPDLAITVLSRRFAELLALPDAFLETRPRLPELVDYLHETGAIGREARDAAVLAFGRERGAGRETSIQELESVGRILEVRQNGLPAGGFVWTLTDITARRRREDEVARAQAEYRMLFENSVTGIYRSSIEGRQLRANPALVRMNGYETEAELVDAMRDLGAEWYVDPERRAEFKRRILGDGRIDDFVSEVYRHRTRERIWVSETAWLIRDDTGEPSAFEGTVVEATARVQAEAEARHMARHDGLTGLPNHFGFNESLEAELETPAGTGSGLAVLCLDLDRFKWVNDTLGHAAGDAVLRLLAGRFRTALPHGSIAARLGGDEFAVIVPDADKAKAIAVADRLLASVRVPVEIDSRPVAIGVSIGIALAPRDGATPSALLKAADVALFGAKGQGRNAWRVFSPGAGAAEAARRSLEIDLRGALGREEFSLSYQPVVALPDRRAIGYEALLRWQRPGQGPVPPEAFIPVAEETRLIVPIGEWVLERACRDAADWPPDLRLAVNVSPVQLSEPSFPGSLAAILERTGFSPDRLVLELTETALLDLPVDLGTLMAPLRARGLRVALDDFGTGYAAWSYLRSGAFDVLKIDASFPARLHEPGTATILATLLELARRLGIETVVEGIETEAQLAHVAAEGCGLIQGRLTGGPRPAEALAPFR